MTTINEIEVATKTYAETRNALIALVTELNDDINRIKRSKLAQIKRAVARAGEKHQELLGLIESNAALFDKPKSRVLHGVKVGFKKQPGALVIADEADTLRRIKQMFADEPALLQQLIKTTEKPLKDGLEELAADKLKKLGVKVTNDSNKAIIIPVDSEVDKIVDALLKGATEEA